MKGKFVARHLNPWLFIAAMTRERKEMGGPENAIWKKKKKKMIQRYHKIFPNKKNV